ncbi:MAG TPA: cupin domain-containing protein [Candidatus Limnocylindrales bacterium]
MTQFVHDTRHVLRYRFPTHTNDLILDRKDSEVAEAFLVRVEPGETVPLHVHGDAEQLFYVLQGEGEMSVGGDAGERFQLRVSDFVRTPRGVPHSVRCVGDATLVYLSIDCFVGSHADSPTWDSHVRDMCAEHGWDFDDVKKGPVELPTSR